MCCARALIEKQGCESGLWLIVIESVTSFQKWKSQRSFDVTLLGQEFEARESVVLHNGDAAGGELDGAAKHAKLVHLQDQGWQAVGGSCGELKKREAFAKISKIIQFSITFCVAQFPPACFLFARLPRYKIFTKIDDDDASLISSIYVPTIFLTSWWCLNTPTTYIQQDYPNCKMMVNVRFDKMGVAENVSLTNQESYILDPDPSLVGFVWLFSNVYFRMCPLSQLIQMRLSFTIASTNQPPNYVA